MTGVNVATTVFKVSTLCWFALLILVVSALACDPYPPTTAQTDAALAAMVFKRHPNGQCFGIVRFNTYGGFSGLSFTAVPSELCK